MDNFEERNLTNNMKVQQFQGLDTENYYARIKKMPNKQFFFELEFKLESNPNYNDPVARLPADYQVFTPKINNITMKMPNVPLLSNWNDIKSVIHKCVMSS